MSTPVKLFIFVVSLIILGILLSNYLVGGYLVGNNEMYPGLQAGERLMINKAAYFFQMPSRGEVICYRSGGEDKLELRRLVGMPGDVVEVKRGTVFLNGVRLIEPYVRESSSFDMEPYQVPLDYYFVLPDNRRYHYQSPEDGTVSRRDIEGRAWILTWPPDRWGSIGHYTLDTQIICSEVEEETRTE